MEDDADIVRTLTELLIQKGYSVQVASRQDEAIEIFSTTQEPFDLVLLDVTLEQGNGFAVCSAIKSMRGDVAVIFLTASDDEFNTVTGLSMGADDYVGKPFRPRELLARIEAVTRRAAASDKNLVLQDVVVNPSQARAFKAGQELELSAAEYKLLLLFARHAQGIITREMIREALYEDSCAYVEDNTISVYIKRLREKIEDDPGSPQIIKTIRGLGYRAQG